MSVYLEAYLSQDFAQPFEAADLSPYDMVRHVLKPEYTRLSDAEIDELLRSILGRLSSGEVEGFWDTLRSVGKSIAGVAQQVAPAVLPIAGGAVGSLMGGPVGTAIGSQLGQMGTQLISGSQRPSTVPPRPSPTSTVPPAPGAAPLPPEATSAAAQLISLIQNPALLQSLLSQVLGGAGKATVQAGPNATPIPVAGVLNALEFLAAQAASEAAYDQGEEESLESAGYLQDGSGNFLVDPANPDERAQRVLALLQESGTAYAPQSYDPVTEWLIEADLLP